MKISNLHQILHIEEDHKLLHRHPTRGCSYSLTSKRINLNPLQGEKKNTCRDWCVLMDTQFKLYSLNQAKQLLGIGRATLNNFINAGLIGIVPAPPGFKHNKISHSEIEKFLSEQTIREQKQISNSNFTNRDVNEFINGKKSRRNDMKDFDSNKLFDQILEQHNGKRI